MAFATLDYQEEICKYLRSELLIAIELERDDFQAIVNSMDFPTEYSKRRHKEGMELFTASENCNNVDGMIALKFERLILRYLSIVERHTSDLKFAQDLARD